jgi:hypothetical protein
MNFKDFEYIYSFSEEISTDEEGTTSKEAG